MSTRLDTPVEVTLAYHYTHEKHINEIKEKGLHCSAQGSFGPGIYLGNKPCAFHYHASIGLIVAVLKGKCEFVDCSIGGIVSANTIIGNHHRRRKQQVTSTLSELSFPPQTIVRIIMMRLF